MLTLFILGVLTPILVFVILDLFHYFDERYSLILKFRNKMEMLDAEEVLNLDETVIKKETDFTPKEFKKLSRDDLDKILGY